MKKYAIRFAFLVFIVFLASCGEGDVVTIPEGDISAAEDNLRDLIGRCSKNPSDEGCPDFSSSDSGSSSDSNPGDNSSNSNPGDSSSSSGGQSSSSTTTSSSSEGESSSSTTTSSSSDEGPTIDYGDASEEDNVGNCGYKWSWCSGWPIEIVKKNMGYTNKMNNVCVFVNNFAKLAAATYKINGESFTNDNVNNSFTASQIAEIAEPVDGGYYIWIPAGANIDGSNKFEVTSGEPNCTRGTQTNAVAICKSYCADKGDKAESDEISKDVEYTLLVYGNENCNLRHTSSGTCEFVVNGTSKTVSSNTNIANVSLNTPTKIKFSGCSEKTRLYCD